MVGNGRYFWNGKPIAGTGIAGLAVASLFFRLDGVTALGCDLLHQAAWTAVDVVRWVILAADWHSVPAYLCEDSRFLEHLLQMGASLWPLFCFVAGRTQ